MSIGWAIISCGDYADSRGAPGINEAEGAELVAVHSQDQGRGAVEDSVLPGDHQLAGRLYGAGHGTRRSSEPMCRVWVV